jgi:formate hydrogenlyase subunit 3/multisubunit Na+/H+ antiporter MnhD subunit
MLLPYTLITAFLGALLVYLTGKISEKLRNFLSLAVSLALLVFVSLLYTKIGTSHTYFSFLGYALVLRVDWLSWFFGIAVVSINLFAIIYSFSDMKGKKRLDLFYLLMLLVNAGMLGVVLSGDFISFYIYWEVMSWSTFLLISFKEEGFSAGLKYIVLSIMGSCSILAGMLVIYSQLGTFNIALIMEQVNMLSTGFALAILTLFCIAFGIKNALMPLHTWLPDSYTETESPFTAVISGMLTRMGMYGFLLILFVIMGLNRYISIGGGRYSFVLSWLGAITIIMGTFIALLQNDAKKLLAWHGIGQGGYMILGIAYGSAFSVAGGIFHTLNHAIYIVLLYFSVGAVEYRTGTRDLNSLGGLIRKMPVAFLGGLLGISGLIGVPLTNGFVSKWLIYKSLILNRSPFLAFAALIGTWGTILSVYKFLHNIFLGQLPSKYSEIKKSPFSMQFPIIVFSTAIILFGVLPGIPLYIVRKMMLSMGFESFGLRAWGIVSETGSLITLNIFFAVLLVILGVYILYRIGFKSKRVLQEDTYAAGHYIPKDKYAYTAEFYAPLFDIIKHIFREWINIFIEKLTVLWNNLSDRIRRIYVGDLGTYVLYIVLFLAFLLVSRLNIW